MIVFGIPKRLGTWTLWKLRKKPRYMAPLTEYALGTCGLRLERTGVNGATKGAPTEPIEPRGFVRGAAKGAAPERGAATEPMEPRGLVRGAATEPIEPKGLVRGVTGRGAAPRKGRPPPKSCGRAAAPERSDTHAAVACMAASISGQSNLLH
jgi:hypothetical protein